MLARIATVTWLAALANLVAQDVTQLKYQYQPGDRYRQIVKLNQQTTTKQGLGEMVVKVNQVMTIDESVSAVDDAGAGSVEQTIKRVQAQIAGPQGQYDLDTDQPAPADPQAAAILEQFALMTGKTFTFRKDILGQIGMVEIPADFPVALGANIKQQIEQSGLVLPEAGIEPGKPWTRKTIVDNDVLKLEVTHTYTFQGMKTVEGRTLATFSVSQAMRVVESKNPTMKITVTGCDSQGLLEFDPALGYSNSAQVKSKIVMTFEVEGQTIEQTLDQTIEMTQERVVTDR